MEMQGKSVVVTGGGKGIGESTAHAFWREGAQVAVLDVDKDAGERVVQGAGDRGLFVACDVSKQAAVAAAFEQIERAFGGVDMLINNAGINHYSTVTDTTEEVWDRILNVNLKSAFLCSKAAIPMMQRRGGGVIVNVSSVQAFMSQKNVAPYTTSKTALLGLTRSIAVDYGPQIRCVAVCPGAIDTPMLRAAIQESPDPEAVYRECEEMHVLQRCGRPEEVAELILFICSDRAAFITGQPIRCDGGLGITIAGSKRDE
jgi:NAD(P)-dependent dehydrogenase (short-subunit alcohol dehydrogenase family)